MCRSELPTKADRGESTREKIQSTIYVGFIDLEKAYDMINREVLWQVLRMYDARGKLLREITNM